MIFRANLPYAGCAAHNDSVADAAAGEGATVIRLPAHGELLADARGGSRWMRVTWHDEVDLVVLSLWKDTSCVGTLRLDRSQVPALVAALVDGLAAPRST